jgi:Lipocalin-like domain
MVQAQAQDFAGTWRLLEYSFHHQDGTVEHPWGNEVIGFLLYTPQGYMSANLSPAHRNWRFRRTRLTAEVPVSEDRRLARLSRRAVPRDYIAYSGRFELKDGTILHHVEVSLFPNWIGLPQLRYYEFRGDQLTLSAPAIKSGRQHIVAQLRWERVKDCWGPIASDKLKP